MVRPAPVDDGRRYDAVRRDFPEMIFAQPAWVHTAAGDWSRVIPLPEDVQFLANLTQHADLNINMASTMTLDFAIHDKPVVNIAFDVASPPPHGRPLWEFFYRFEHYRPVVELGAARFARSPDELADHVNAYLEDPSLDREGRRKLVELEVGELLSSYEFPGDEIPVIRGSALLAMNCGCGKRDCAACASIFELMDAVDRYIPQPVREIDKPFLMPVEDVFSITGRGTVATGRVEQARSTWETRSR